MYVVSFDRVSVLTSLQGGCIEYLCVSVLITTRASAYQLPKGLSYLLYKTGSRQVHGD